MGNIRSFRELPVWQKGLEVAMRVLELTGRFPAEERYSLTEQLHRASRSVPANIAEAWRKRRCPAAFVSKLNDAEGEAAETQTHLEIVMRCRYLGVAEARELGPACGEILAMLTDMAAHPEQWTIRK